jgi:hypothetical protein
MFSVFIGNEQKSGRKMFKELHRTKALDDFIYSFDFLASIEGITFRLSSTCNSLCRKVEHSEMGEFNRDVLKSKPLFQCSFKVEWKLFSKPTPSLNQLIKLYSWRKKSVFHSSERAPQSIFFAFFSSSYRNDCP